MVARTQLARPDTSERPFALPNHELITTILDLPSPPSVNRTRRFDMSSHAKTKNWLRAADNLMLLQRQTAKHQKIGGRYELLIQLSETIRLDADNGIKALIDYLRRIELVVDDSPKYLRRLVVEWCHPAVAPEGCRVTIQELAL
jgi:Holliday junction resolvase RusA-like endonuclease